MTNYVDVHIRGKNEIPPVSDPSSGAETDKLLRVMQELRKNWTDLQQQVVKSHDAHQKTVRKTKEDFGFFGSAVEEFGKKLIAAFSVYEIEEFVRASILAFASADRAARDAQGIVRVNSDQLRRIRDDLVTLEKETGEQLETLFHQYARFAAGAHLEGEKATTIFDPIVEAASTMGVRTEDMAGAATASMANLKLSIAQTREEIKQWQDILPGLGGAFLRHLPGMTRLLRQHGLNTEKAGIELSAVYKAMLPTFGGDEEATANALEQILQKFIADPKFALSLEKMRKDGGGALDLLKMNIKFLRDQKYDPQFLARMYSPDVIVGIEAIEENYANIGKWMKEAAADVETSHDKIQKRNEDFTGSITAASAALREFRRTLGEAVAPTAKGYIDSLTAALEYMRTGKVPGDLPNASDLDKAMHRGGIINDLSRQFMEKHGQDYTPAQGFAVGGIVTQPTFAMLGEAGPEAVVPLGDLKREDFEQRQKSKEAQATVSRIHDLAMQHAPQPRFRDWDDIISGRLAYMLGGGHGGGGSSGGAGASGTYGGDGTTKGDGTSKGDGTTGDGTQPASPEAAGTFRPVYKLGGADLSDAVVNTVAGEAYTNNQESVDAVINNMLNRVGSKGWGPSGDLQQVARARGQYAGYRRANAKEAAFIRERIKAIASGGVKDNTGGSNEYRAGSYRGPWYQHHRDAPVIGGNRFAYNPSSRNGPYAPYKKMAEGGIVTEPTMALVGEAGPEVVVPLSQFGERTSQARKTSLQSDIDEFNAPPPPEVVENLRKEHALNLFQEGEGRYGGGRFGGWYPAGVTDRGPSASTINREINEPWKSDEAIEHALSVGREAGRSASLTGDGGSSGGAGSTVDFGRRLREAEPEPSVPQFGSGFGGGATSASQGYTPSAANIHPNALGFIRAIGRTETDFSEKEAYADATNRMSYGNRTSEYDYGYYQMANRDIDYATKTLHMSPDVAQHLTGGPTHESTYEQQTTAVNEYLQRRYPDAYKNLVERGDYEGMRQATRRGKSWVWFGLKDKPGEAAAEYERTRAGASSEVPLPRERPSIQPQVLSEAREGARPESGAPILHPQTRRKVRREISRQHNAFQDHAEHHGRHFAAHGSAGHVS